MFIHNLEFILLIKTLVLFLNYKKKTQATILRTEGDVEQSLKIFQQCHKLNPKNVNTMKQIGKSLSDIVNFLIVKLFFKYLMF